MIDLETIDSVADTWLELSSRRPGPIAQLCHLLSVVPEGVCKVSVTFLRTPLTAKNDNYNIQGTGDDSFELFDCSDPDHSPAR